MMRSKVIGIYGVSGSGKSRALSETRKSRPEWRCLEGTDVIRQIMEDKGGFVAFEAMDEANKTVIRSQAAKRLQEFSGITVVGGHCSFPRVVEVDVSGETAVVFEDVFTSEDTETYDFVLYLDKDPEVVWKQREADTLTSKRARPALSTNVIRRWMEHEKAVLHDLCEEHGIYFAILSQDTDPASHIAADILPALVEAAQNHSHEALCQTVRALPEADIYLLVDGDRTLFAGDLGSMFFAAVKGDTVDYLKPIFKRHPSYTFQAFLEISMLYGNSVPESDYLRLCNAVGRSPNVGLYTQWLAFLEKLPPNVHPVLLTSGIREAWQAALDAHGLTMSVIAGNHAGLHPYLVDDRAKATVATELRRLRGGCRIISFGDSVTDLPMFHASDRAYVVLDDRRNRSLRDFLLASSGDCGIFQLAFRPDFEWHTGIQVGSLPDLLAELSGHGSIHSVIDFTTSTAGALLATSSRRSDFVGPQLQAVHEEIGRFLADRLLDTFGKLHGLVQETDFPHVQGRTFRGLATATSCSTSSESSIVVLPLMRGGEPMSRGVHQRFPSAQLVHWYDDGNPPPMSLEKTTDVLIVDSVVNQGRSVRRVLQYLFQRVNKSCRVYVLTGVMQKDASLTLPLDYPRVRFLALRVSENSYTGQGGTDTGNRLFMTY